ncbi:hypothetical protein DW962_00905 [Blautia sp. AM46-5]|nr:hypothetical protein DW962_00905 [Blautia sp. AM46-5]RHS57415.1 hypothetical protein DW961_06700 [Blautia sp. AM46-3MH]
MENALLELKGKLKMLYASYGAICWYCLSFSWHFLYLKKSTGCCRMWKGSIRFLWCYLLH